MNSAVAIAPQYWYIHIKPRSARNDDNWTTSAQGEELVAVNPHGGVSFNVMTEDGHIGLVVSDGPFDMKSDAERAMFEKTWTGQTIFPDDTFDVEWFDDALVDNPLRNGPGTYVVTIAWRYRYRIATEGTPIDHSDSFYETVMITTKVAR